MKLLELNLTQKDCPHINISKKYKDIFIYIMNTRATNLNQKIFSIFYSDNKNSLDNALKDFTIEKNVNDFLIISKKDNVAAVIYSIRKTSAYKKVEEKGFRLHPVIVNDGIEKWFILEDFLYDIEYKELIDENTNIISFNELSTKNFLDNFIKNINIPYYINKLNNLDEKERELLQILISTGYFDWPRKMSVSALSKKLKIPKSTISYQIRKIEKNLAKLLARND